MFQLGHRNKLFRNVRYEEEEIKSSAANTMKKVKKKTGPTNNSGANTPKTGIFQHVWHSIELFKESKSDYVGLLYHWRIYPK